MAFFDPIFPLYPIWAFTVKEIPPNPTLDKKSTIISQTLGENWL